jgi:hypothetical protein
MKNKSFLSKFTALKPRIPEHLEVERKLLPRLKFMGYVMYVWCIASLIFAIAIPQEEGNPMVQEASIIEADAAGFAEDVDKELPIFSSTEVLNFYVVSLIFALVGVSCFLIAWRKQKKLFHHHH